MVANRRINPLSLQWWKSEKISAVMIALFACSAFLISTILFLLLTPVFLLLSLIHTITTIGCSLRLPLLNRHSVKTTSKEHIIVSGGATEESTLRLILRLLTTSPDDWNRVATMRGGELISQTHGISPSPTTEEISNDGTLSSIEQWRR